MYPTLAFFLAEVPDVELQTVLCRAYNDSLPEHCKADPSRLMGIALLPLNDVGASIHQLERCTNDYGFRGAFVRPNPYAGRNIQNRTYEPFGDWAKRSVFPSRYTSTCLTRCPRTCSRTPSSRWRPPRVC